MSGTRRVPLRVPADHPALPGHFPSAPVVPGVLLLDAVVSALEAGAQPAPRLCGIRQAKFLRPLLPGQDACIELTGPPARPRFRILAGTVVIALGELELSP